MEQMLGMFGGGKSVNLYIALASYFICFISSSVFKRERCKLLSLSPEVLISVAFTAILTFKIGPHNL